MLRSDWPILPPVSQMVRAVVMVAQAMRMVHAADRRDDLAVLFQCRERLRQLVVRAGRGHLVGVRVDAVGEVDEDAAFRPPALSAASSGRMQSSSGRASETPRPRRTCRRLRSQFWERIFAMMLFRFLDGVIGVAWICSVLTQTFLGRIFDSRPAVLAEADDPSRTEAIEQCPSLPAYLNATTPQGWIFVKFDVNDAAAHGVVVFPISAKRVSAAATESGTSLALISP